MRISDWSSDVCSSDLRAGDVDLLAEGGIGSGDAVIDLLAHGHFELEEPLDLFPLHEAGHLEQLGAVPFDGFLRVGGQLVAVRQGDADDTAHLAGAVIGRRNRRRIEHQRLAAFERSEEHTSELQSLMRISYAVFCLKKKTT